MATEVDICNLALAYLGDDATIASIKPPEGSAQAEKAARFYPIARDTLLEMHTWNFTMKRGTIALTTNTLKQWEYAYAAPADMISPIAILDPNAQNDYATRMSAGDTPGNLTANSAPTVVAGQYMPQAFAIETDVNGLTLIYTNQENALLRYTAKVTDPTKFSSLFVNTLSWHLASMLAGPVIKGDQGMAEGKRCTQVMQQYLLSAKQQDNLQRDITVEHIVPWTSGR
tara:strand:+ start:298 stop:981 length:684 start_codon:yes stop_codon:yes gene_type:complete